MGFGLSGSPTLTLMDGADVTIAWVDNSFGARAVDYHLRNGNRVQVYSRLLKHHTPPLPPLLFFCGGGGGGGFVHC